MTDRSGGRFAGLRIVWLQSPPWDGLWTRQNHFALRLAREGADILYVENPVAIRTRLKAGDAARAPRQVAPGLTVMPLPLQIPGGRDVEWIGRLNGRRFAGAVNAWLKAQGWDDYLVWCRVPLALHALEPLNPRAVIYDVTDDYEFYARSDGERALTTRLEALMAARAAQVFTTTEQLAQKLSALTAAPVTVVPNGADASFFETPTGPDPLGELPHPRIGYVGLVADWMDFDLLAKLGQRWPGQVVIVGPVKPEVQARFDAVPGIVRIGGVPQTQVPAYLHAFDVCIVPHVISELRHRADPLKIVEYLATGKPVVSVALRPLEALRPQVDTATTHDEFLALVQARLTDPRADLAPMRRDTAAARNWDTLYQRVAEGLARLRSPDPTA